MRGRNIASLEKTAIFIDGWYLARTTKDYFKKEVDFEKLLKYFSQNAYVLRAYYYIGEEAEKEARENQMRFITWLRRNGYKVITKPIRTFINEKGEMIKKADFDVDITIDMLDLADKLDKIVLISGDGDFAKLIERVGRKGVKTQVIAHWGRGKGNTASELMEAADVFIELEEIMSHIARE